MLSVLSETVIAELFKQQMNKKSKFFKNNGDKRKDMELVEKNRNISS